MVLAYNFCVIETYQKIAARFLSSNSWFKKYISFELETNRDNFTRVFLKITFKNVHFIQFSSVFVLVVEKKDPSVYQR